jgi:hypothetical protein
MIIVNRLFEDTSANCFNCYQKLKQDAKNSNLVISDWVETPISKYTKVQLKISSTDLYNAKKVFPDAEMLNNEN